jgi:pyruvate kinase
MTRKVKIVATLGPASSDEAILRRLFQAGVDVARLNFSHGTHTSHGELIDRIRKVSDETGKPVTILQDLQGPKLRVGILPEDGFHLEAGQEVILARPEVASSLQQKEEGHPVIPFDVPDFAQKMSAGSLILLDDGHLEMEVTGVEAGAVRARVVLGGLLTSNKGVNLPGTRLGIAGFTEKDAFDLAFGLKKGVDAIAISFVGSAKDIELVRGEIRKQAPEQSGIPLIAKMELPEAIENMEEITQAADGLMVARGDLAVETSPAVVPVIQKRMIDHANRQGKLVITATQMLESMINNPRPTRAEASDVANAVWDGTDAVMLSAESAVGSFPVESVRMMDTIVRSAEESLPEWGRVTRLEGGPTADKRTSNDAISTTRAAREMARDMDVSNIAIFTRSGRTAQLMAKTRPQVPILAFTPELQTYRRLGLYWGVMPFLVAYTEDMEQMMEFVEQAIKSSAGLMPGQQVVLVTSFPVGGGQAPNLTLLHTLRE